MSCDPKTLVADAKCLACDIPPGMEWPVLIALTAQVAGASLDPSILASGASQLFGAIPSGYQLPSLIGVTCEAAAGGGGSVPVNDPDVAEFIIPAGITDPTTISALDVLVITLKKLGVWTSFDAIYPFVGGTANSCSYNLVDPTKYQIAWHGNMTFDSTGITGDGGTAYGDTGFVPSTATTPKYGLNSGSVGNYCRDVGTNPASEWMGCQDGVSAMFFFGGVLGTTTWNNTLAGGVGAATPSFHGTNIGVRNDAASVSVYSATGTSNTGASASVALPTRSFYVLAQNAGVAASFCANNLAFSFIGGVFTAGQVAQIQTAILTFETALGRA